MTGGDDTAGANPEEGTERPTATSCTSATLHGKIEICI